MFERFYGAQILYYNSYLLLQKNRGMIMDNRVQWHPGFCAAMELELWDNRDDLEYEREYNLSKKPLQADLLVIRKRQNASIHNEIGRIFRTWNLMEYKSQVDSMNIDDFYK